MSMMVSFIAEGLGSIFEMDEIYQEPLPDGRLKIVFLTTGFDDNLVKLKTYLFTLTQFPVQVPEEIKVHQDQAGAILKRYRVEVIVRPVFGRGGKGGGEEEE